MKKTLTIALSLILLFSIFGCANNAELKSLKEETKDLKQQLSVVPSPRPLLLRQEMIDALQDEYNTLKTQMPEITTDTYVEAAKVMDVLMENYNKQTDIVKGINSEEEFYTLTNKVSDLNDKYETYLHNGNKKEAQEVEKQINIILYGNEQGDKTW